MIQEYSLENLTSNDAPSGNLHPVNVRRLRFAIRDLLASSAAGESIFSTIATIAPILRVDVFSLAWTGNNDSPLSVRCDARYGDIVLEDRKSTGRWFNFHKNSPLVRIALRESRAYYPDATRDYAAIREFGQYSWKLVLGKRMIGVVFDRQNSLARLDQQVYNLLDIISQTLLDFYRRQLRHFQDQYVMAEDSDHPYDPGNIDDQVANFMDGNDDQGEELSLQLLRKNAQILENFFGFTHVEYLIGREISAVLFYHNTLEVVELQEHEYCMVRLAVSDYEPNTVFNPARMHVIECTIPWGLSNDEHQFWIRLYCYHEVNPHIRRELLLNQALIRTKSEVEALFDRRYRELRIAQDVAHFRRCWSARTEQKTLKRIRDHILNSVPDYGVQIRSVPRAVVFPEYDAWKEGLARVFVNIEHDPLVFNTNVRMNDIRDYRYITIRAPELLRALLINAMDPGVRLRIFSDFPALTQKSDPDLHDLSPDSYTEKTVYFNDAATISVLVPSDVSFPFQRLREMFDEYLESVGEGIGRLLTYVNMNSGIANRSALTGALDYMAKQVQYSNQVTIEVSSLDIVSFKIFNELFGHPFGDRVIRHVANKVDGCLPGSAYHVSGDEYYVLHAWFHDVSHDWVRDFFRDRGIWSEAVYQDARKKLDSFVKGVPVCVPLSDATPTIPAGNHPLGTYQLTNLIANFFTKSADGTVGLKKYSRTGNDYDKVIWDPQHRIQELVDRCWSALQARTIDLDGESFASFVLKENTVGEKLFILPRLTIGTERYTQETVLAYASDIIDAADRAAGKLKK